MKNSEITIGKVYKIKTNKTIVTATLVDLDKTDNSWICETADKKLVVVKSREIDRFLEEVPPKQISIAESKPEVKEIFAKANAAKIAAQFGFCTQEQADAIAAEAKALAEQLSTTVKDKMVKASAAKIAAEHGFCSKELAESLAKDAADAKNALRAIGHGRVGGGIRSGMSGLDAAYKILLESGQPMNAKSITKIALEKGIWNPQGSTPDMTLSAALQNDVKKKGDQSRFAKADQPGHYIARLAK
jgi:hypothetical protein